MTKLLKPLAAQVNDLRSVSAREAGVTIQVIAANCQHEFDHTAVKLIPHLVKVLHSGNKLLADVGHQAIKGIIKTVEN